MLSRSEREKAAYDEQGVFERSHGWHVRFKHVFDCPNTVEHERAFSERVKADIAGKRVLEIGCGDGSHAEQLLSFGAAYVYGIDISEKFIARAKERGIPGRLEFAERDAIDPVGGTFDIIFGRAILHHLDYRPVLKRLHDRNLSPDGFMIFMEPLGAHPLIRLFHAVARSAHTRDERPFYREDLCWLRDSFARLEILPVNFLSLPFGLLSSLVFERADNLMMRVCDKADRWLAAHVPPLVPSFRQAILVIGK